MTIAQIEAGTLEANLEERTVTGLLLPYDEIGNTNLGKFEVPKGTVKIPRDPGVVMGKIGHNQENPVAPATALLNTDAGVVATFKIADTDDGDALLLDIESRRKAGKPMALSAEVKNIVLRAGKLVSGTLFGAAFVEKGAFPSAALMAEDVGDTEPTPEPVATPEPVVTETPAPTITPAAAPAAETEPTVAIPNTLEASAAPKASELSFHQFATLLGKVISKSADDIMLAAFNQVAGPSEDTLFATLTDIKLTTSGSIGVNSGMLQPQWLGELKKLANAKYKQKVLPLFAHEDLTSFTINGFRWTTEFTGGDWGGDKAAIPSNAPATAAATTSANRFGGAWDVAREYRDFNVPGFWESLYTQSARSYLKWADGKVTASILAGATSTAADNPSGLTIGAGWSALIDGAAALVATGIGIPEFALVEPSLYKSMLKIPAVDVLGYLNAALGLDEGTIQQFSIRPVAALSTGNVLVGVGEAATVFELPGVPIRAEGLDMTKGGIDPGLFGYEACIIEDADGLQLITPYVAP